MGLGSSARDSTGWNPSWAWAAGQIVSTPADMLAWSPEMYQSELLSDEMSEARLELVDILPEEALENASGSNDAGYGFGVLYDQGWYGHDGLISGYTTMVAHNPALEASLVIMSNSDAISDEHTLATGQAYYEIKQILAREYGEQEAQE
jgi:D-alanyl-D-alanine carboxypeptidase